MSEDLKGLIEKIREDGVRHAEEKAREIENRAQEQGEAIIKAAQKQAQGLLDQARAEIARLEKSGAVALEQAARNMLLTLRQELNAMLKNIVLAELRHALTTEETVKIIAELIAKAGSKERPEIVVLLSEKDLEKLKTGLLHKLSDEVKRRVVLKPDQDIAAGFVISYDAGKSYFDFSDKALAEYLENYLKPQLAQILQKVATEEKGKGVK